MNTREVRSKEDMRRLAEEHGARNVTIALTDTTGLLREKYVSRDKFLSGMQ